MYRNGSNLCFGQTQSTFKVFEPINIIKFAIPVQALKYVKNQNYENDQLSHLKFHSSIIKNRGNLN